MAPKKKKASPINYSSLESAKASSPSFDHDDWFDDGVQQESQGDRYQHGAKAARHYTNAIVSYRLASSLSPNSFDPIYNAARVMFSLSTDHLEAPACVAMMYDAIATFRRAHSVASGSDEQIDSTFNLAQALVALQELLEDGATPSPPSTSTHAPSHALLLEAKQLFAQVEAMQRASMDHAFQDGGAAQAQATNAGGMEDDDPAFNASDTGSATTRTATEGRIVTPQVVIDTLLEAIELDLELYMLAMTSDPTAAASFADSAAAALSRAGELHRSDPLRPTSVELHLTLTQLSLNATCASSIPPSNSLYLDPSRVLSTYQSLVASQPNNASLLSSYADYLLEYLPLTPSSLPLLEMALSTYASVQTLLSSRLQPPKDVPSYRIPSLLSANLVSQVEALLLIHHLSSATTNDLLIRARESAVEAIKCSGSGYSIEFSPSVRILKLPGDARKDWMTIRATRRAWFWMIRILIRLEEGGVSGWLGLVRAWEKIVPGRRGKEEVRWLLMEEGWRGDRIWVVSEGMEEGAWSQVLAE